MGLKVVRDPAALELEGTLRRPTGVEGIPLEDDRVVARPRHGERSREPRDAASSDNELHLRKLFSLRGRLQGAGVCNATTKGDCDATTRVGDRNGAKEKSPRRSLSHRAGRSRVAPPPRGFCFSSLASVSSRFPEMHASFQERAFDRHSTTVSPWRWATFHSPPSRRYTCVARKV